MARLKDCDTPLDQRKHTKKTLDWSGLVGKDTELDATMQSVFSSNFTVLLVMCVQGCTLLCAGHADPIMMKENLDRQAKEIFGNWKSGTALRTS